MLTIYDAMKLSRRPFTVAALKAIATSDELFSVLPFVPKAGEGFSYMREKTLGSFNFVSDTHTTVGESTGSDELVVVPKREAVEDFYVRNMAQENLSDAVSQVDRQTMKKMKAAGRKIASTFVNGGHVTGFTIENFQSGPLVDSIVAGPRIDSERYGPGHIRYVHGDETLEFMAPGDSRYGAAVDISGGDGEYLLRSHNPNKWLRVTIDRSDATADAERAIRFNSTTHEFDGIEKLCADSQIRSADGADGDSPSFEILDELLDAVKVMENPAFVMHSSVRRKYDALFRAMGGATPATLPNTSTQVPTYKGVPMLKNDWIPVNESKGNSSNLSSVYLASLVEDEGVYMGALGGERFEVEADPRDASVLGFRLWDLGQIQSGPSAQGRRLAWYGSAAVGSDLALARASQLKTA